MQLVRVLLRTISNRGGWSKIVQSASKHRADLDRLDTRPIGDKTRTIATSSCPQRSKKAEPWESNLI